MIITKQDWQMEWFNRSYRFIWVCFNWQCYIQTLLYSLEADISYTNLQVNVSSLSVLTVKVQNHLNYLCLRTVNFCRKGGTAGVLKCMTWRQILQKNVPQILHNFHSQLDRRKLYLCCHWIKGLYSDAKCINWHTRSQMMLIKESNYTQI